MAQEYESRIWAGDSTTVAEARAKYKIDPDGNLIPFATALYSFRENKEFADEFLGLREQLVIHAKAFLHVAAQRQLFYQDVGYKADLFSTYLEWMSRQHNLSDEMRQELSALALKLCECGILYSPNTHSYRNGNHTWCLLQLTLARLYLNKNRLRDVSYRLNLIAVVAPQIRDMNQRVRVYRKLGLLYRKNSSPVLGFCWGIKACLSPGLSMKIRFKGAAIAFCGNDY